MGNRSHKRSETVDDMPADKRACSEVRPSSSNSSVQAPTHSNSEPHNADMDTSSSASWSNRSDGEAERDYSGYGTCDSDGDQRRSSLREYYHRQRSMSDYGKFKRVLSSLEQEIGESEILVSLSELCELLSFCGDSSLAGSVADLMSPILVKLTRHETNADIMLLSVRAITYLCDANPRSSALLVRHDAVVALCQRLMAIEYLDVAEQCLQALEKISLEQPLVCLQSGVVMAVLTYIDFFSTSVQRVALSTVVNICQKLPSDFSSFFMDAVPILCNLLQYEDRQLVEHVATCLIKIAERVHQSPDMLNQLCKHELIQQTVHLISLNCRTTLSQPVQSGLVGLLVKLTSGSIVAVQNLFELRISSILKDVLSTHVLSHGTVSPYIGDGHMDQVHEVLKLLNELLPSVAIDKVIPLNYEKEALLKNKPSHLLKFGTDLLSVLIQVVNSGANMYVCYGCMSVIKSIVYFSSSEILIEVLTDTDISSFLAGVFSRKDQHVMMLGLQITDTVLQKLSDVFLSSFIKEGVFFAIDTLLKSENCKEIAFSSVSDIQLSDDAHKKSATRSSIKCLCYSFDAGPPANDSERICKLEKDSLYNLAKKIRSNYFPAEILNHEQGVTDVLQKLRCLADTLTQCVNISLCKDSPRQQDEICLILYQIMSQLNGEECVSTFELLESGIVKALLKYLCNNRQYPEEKSEATYGSNRMYDEEKRVNVFGRVLISSQDAPAEDFVLLTRKLQASLSSIESFPLIQSHLDKQRAGYATVPLRRCLSYPSLRIHFVRAEGEACLSEYSEGIVTVDSFSTLDAIERYLWPKVGKNRSEHEPTEAIQKSGSPKVDSDNNSDMKQDNAVDRSHSSSEDNSMNIDYSRFSDEDTTPKLQFFLDGHLIDPNSSLYQAVVQQQNNAAHETDNSGKLWSQLYKITYRKAVGPSKSYPPYCPNQDHDSSNDSISRHWRCSPFSPDRFISTFSSELRSSIPVYDVLLLLKILEGMNRFSFHLMSREKLYAFAEGKFADLDKLKAMLYTLPQNEFVSKKLTEKLEQQLRDPLSVSVGGMPSWCGRLMASCPFLFSFEVRCKYFGLTAFGKSRVQQHMASHDDSGGVRERRQSGGLLPRKKFLVCRDQILESAAKMMELHACQKVILEVEYNEEVGTGLGPTLEFFTLVGHEFQKNGLGMWREDHILLPNIGFLREDTQMIGPSCQLFPRPWSSSMTISNGIEFSEVVKKFSLLGQITARVLQDGRVLDIPFSRAFYKLILGQELTAYDIHSFDPELGKTLLEFQAIIERKKHLKSVSGGTPVMEVDSCFRNTTIEDLCLDFTLPGYPDYVLSSGSNPKLVNMANLDEYVSLIVDATICSGISRQVEAFKSGFNQVFPIKHLQIFNEEELERLLCGECEFWSSNELLDHIKFDHGYTACSPPILNLLEIIQEFDREHQRAFLQFVTGAPRLPRGGLASLNPKLTIVRKHCNWNSDDDLPSVMTCANYLKLPPYSSKEMMKKKLMYAITEGQGSFHLS